ncbi:MAG: carbohydrate kinase family protein [Pseudonocardiales bacterium]|nr:carbohydrate kinase family protein [Actinomycetota bacterium]PZS20862.1 MAG: carbohydrate kinase family protein [Pseudonocardiales bacterium]
MGIIVTGSIATDHLAVFPGRFVEQILPDQLENLSVSFLVEDLAIRRGGAAANIAFNLGCLGLAPALVGAVGADFAEYGQWLSEHGVDISAVHVSSTLHTARFLCTTDSDQNQIASFYAGAMTESRDIELKPIVDRMGGTDLVVVGPSDPVAMQRHSQECRERGYPFAADPSQQLAWLDGDEIKRLVEGATYLFTNTYERGLLEHKTGWGDDDILARVGVSVMTRGAKGVTVRRPGEPVISVMPPQDLAKADPTGVGDAFRAGFLAGVHWGIGDERSAQLGCMLATLVIESVGTQEHKFEPETFMQRFSEAYGPDSAAEVAAHVHA